jgi:hypothetical protein
VLLQALALLLLATSSAQAQQRLSRRRRPPIGGPNPPNVGETATGCLVTKPPSQGSSAYCERNVTRSTETIFCSRFPRNAFDTPPVPGKMVYRARDGNKRFAATDYR